MASQEEIENIIRKIVEGKATEEEKEVLLQISEKDEQIKIQVAKQINNISKGQGNHFGDRTSYNNRETTEVIQRSREEKLFIGEIKKDINGQLSISLFVDNTKLINLNKELQQELVNCPWTQDIKNIPNFKELNSEQSTVLEIFEHAEIAGKLLIVGEPGAGKTTTSRELAKQLVIKAEKDVSVAIPVLVNLADWNGKRSIGEWIAETISIVYRRAISTIKEWFSEQKILPILDGLDELDPSLQELCIRAINIFLSQENCPSSLIVCSRREEYINCETKLELNGAVCLLPLSNRNIESYLHKIDKNFLWSTFSQDSNLLELSRTPLFFNLAIVAFQDRSSAKWEEIESSEERLEYLWNKFIFQRLDGDKRKRQQQIKWLAWTAQQLSKKYEQPEQTQLSFLYSCLKNQTNIFLSKLQNKAVKSILLLAISIIKSVGISLSFTSIIFNYKKTLIDKVYNLSSRSRQKPIEQISTKPKIIIAELQPDRTLNEKQILYYVSILFLIVVTLVNIAIYLENELSAIPLDNNLFLIMIIVLALLELQIAYPIQPIDKTVASVKPVVISIASAFSFGITIELFFHNIKSIAEFLIISFIAIQFLLFIAIFLSFVSIITNRFLTFKIPDNVTTASSRIANIFFSSSNLVIKNLKIAFFIYYFSSYKLFSYLYYNIDISLITLVVTISTPCFLVIFLLAFMGRFQWTWFSASTLPSFFLITSPLYFLLLISPLCYLLIFCFFRDAEQAWYVGIISGLIFGQIVNYALIRNTYNGSVISALEKLTHSNQGIRKSFINATIIGITVCLIVGLTKDFSQGVSIGLIFWIISGGVACVQHFCLRIVLYFSGYIPWDYNQFLNYATERTLLQRVGGSYVFIHSLLQEHFVKMPLETKNK